MTNTRRPYRHVADPHMHLIDHALGHPIDPLRETYRNRFVVPLNTDIARHMASSSHWEHVTTVNHDQTACYRVTEAGRAALVEHLAELEQNT